jgi:hypothetical protein
MPRDHHGVLHAGSLGLFDDLDELDATHFRAERHEREYLESVIRHQQRREARQYRKNLKAATNTKPPSRLPWPISLLVRFFGGVKDTGPADDKKARQIREPIEYIVVRRPETPELVYTEEDVDPVHSLWLEECGMVRVRSKDPGGCHIVPKDRIVKVKDEGD